MATKLENLDLEIAHFNNFRNKISGCEDLCQNTITRLLQFGIIQVSTAFELALANSGGHQVVSENTHDLSDGSDAKLSCVRTYNYGNSYGAPVTNIYGKTGSLRVQVYERKNHKFYYFVIPQYAYSHVPKSSNIEIPFYIDGSPRRVPSRVVSRNWWNYEVASFEEMSRK
jgi:hypothetical protein